MLEMESNMRLKYKDLVRFSYFSVILSSHQTQTEILNFPDKRPKNEDKLKIEDNQKKDGGHPTPSPQ